MGHTRGAGGRTADTISVFHINTMKLMHVLAFILVVVGGLNWGLVGLGGFMMADWNLVHMLVGAWPTLEWLVYILVGLSAAWMLMTHKKDCKECSA